MNRRDLFRGAGALALSAAVPLPGAPVHRLARAFPPGTTRVIGDALYIKPGEYIFGPDGVVLGRVTSVSERTYWK